jgi:hypothetical protein
MVPMPAGTYVVHYGKGIHYDGAKDGDTIIMLHGMGPATSTPAEKKQTASIRGTRRWGSINASPSPHTCSEAA